MMNAVMAGRRSLSLLGTINADVLSASNYNDSNTVKLMQYKAKLCF